MGSAMTHRERVLGCFDRTGYDRIPVKHEGTPEVNQMLMEHLRLKNMEHLLRVSGGEFRYVEPVHAGPELRTFPDGSMEGYWGERYKCAESEGGKYLESSYRPFAGVERLEDLDRSHFPEAGWFDYSCAQGRNYHDETRKQNSYETFEHRDDLGRAVIQLCGRPWPGVS